jgi:ParB family chromosome partitioning protein
MNLQSIKTAQCYESETNPRGKEFEGKSFDELVASIKEKGVLVPVLARKRQKGGKEFEVVAGNRRLRAAKEAGLAEIPAQVVEMTDEEAREAQIIENLQREDVHPLEEGEAYRQLVEDKDYDVKNLALRVGKSETYVRHRLFLTNLIESAAKKYRKGEFTEEHVVLIAKLTPEEQKMAMKYLDDRYEMPDAGDLKYWITDTFYQPLSFQPWAKDPAIAKVVGPCKSCPPNRPSLFGAVKEGQCTDLRCWSNKMAAYLKHRLDEDDSLVMVTKSYGTPNMKGTISRSDYIGLSTKKKDHCEYAEQGLVVEGANIGTTIWLCRDTDCKQHHADHSNSGYATSPKEKENRQKEREKEQARRAKFDETVAVALAKVKWPLSQKHLDALFDLMFDQASSTITVPLLKRHGLKALVKKSNGYTSRDYKTPLRELAESGGSDGKLRMMFELILPTCWTHTDDKGMTKKVAKL